MDDNVKLTLSSPDVAQILDALSQRLAAWKNTKEYLLTGYADDNYCVEECSDAEEAHRIGKRYGVIMNSIKQQAYG